MKYCSLLLISLGMLIFACNDPIGIGSGILDEGDTDVAVDTIPITAFTAFTDSVVSLSLDSLTTLYRVGNLEDGIYGSTEAITYFNASLVGSLPSELRDEDLVDSVVLILGYDTLGRYGADGLNHDLELLQTVEPLNNFDRFSDTLFSTDEIEVESTPIWSGQAFVSHTDSLVIGDYLQDTLGQMIGPQLRIPLDVEEWTDLLASRSFPLSSSDFSELLPGFALRSSTPNSVIGLELNNQTNLRTSRILFHYRADTVRRVFALPLGGIRHTQTIYDDTGSELGEERIKDDQEILYLQPQGNAEIEIDISALLDQGEFILNSGRLELTVVDPLDPTRPIPELLRATYMQDGQEFSVIDFATNNSVRFDGGPSQTTVNGEVAYVYTLDLSGHLNFVLDGLITDTTIRVFTSPRENIPNRTRIFGPNHPTHPLVLKAITTRP